MNEDLAAPSGVRRAGRPWLAPPRPHAHTHGAGLGPTSVTWLATGLRTTYYLPARSRMFRIHKYRCVSVCLVPRAQHHHHIPCVRAHAALAAGGVWRLASARAGVDELEGWAGGVTRVNG